MSYDLVKMAVNFGFDDAYLLPELFSGTAADFGLLELNEIMPDANAVLLLITAHNPYRHFPKGAMRVHSHYPASNKSYVMHKDLIDKLNSMNIAAESANMLPLKPYASAAGMVRLKNSLAYHEMFGTYFTMQAIAIRAEADFMPKPGGDLCKDCTKCIEACPTGAIGRSGIINSARCLRSHVPVKEFIPSRFRELSGNTYIGCGICQAVCPLNSGIAHVHPPKELCEALNIEGILNLESDDNPIKKLQTILGKNEVRPGRAVATACMAAGNSQDEKYLPYLEQILTQYINPLTRGYAAWAIGRIGEDQGALFKALLKEHNPQAKSEIISALKT